MYVSEPAWQLEAWAAPEIREIHLHARRGMKIPTIRGGDVLWLSRSKLARGRVAYDECLLEWVLGDHVTIVHPETMSLVEQLAIIEAGSTVIGVLGSAFHTLLMALEIPNCIYLCPDGTVTKGADSRFQSAYIAQDRMLNVKSRFVYACADTGSKAHRFFPGGFRLLIPEVLQVLSDSVLPGLREDPRAAALLHPERVLHAPGGGRRLGNEIEIAMTEMLRDPLSIDTRMRLGTVFEAEGNDRCAVEQFMTVADLADDPAPALLRAARIVPTAIGERP
jgi:hypothetical protein